MLVAPAGLACSDTSRPGDGRLARVEGRVSSSQRGVYFDVAFEPAPSLAEVTAAHPTAAPALNVATFARELAVQGEPAWASGVLTIPAEDGGDRIVAPAPANNPIRYTCGITLVSPSYAITAGHCVTDSDSDTSAIKLRLYRITPALAKTYVPAALSGTFPSYSQPNLSASDGFLFDEYECTLLNRCYGGPDDPAIACPDPTKDMALLHCDGRPGDKYGFVNANSQGDPGGKEALVHWKHEVLDLGALEASLPQDRIDHYVAHGTSPEQNYHYFDDAADLLPLRSVTWSDGTPTSWGLNYWSDLHGCHGTSGSGMLVRVGSTPLYELVGPVARGGSAFGLRLCEQVPNPSGATSGKGTQAMGADGLSPTALINLHSADFATDCHARASAERDVSDLPFDAGPHDVSTLFSHLTCQLDELGATGTVIADSVFGPYPERFIEDRDTAHVIHNFAHDVVSRRVAFDVMPREACSSDCGALTLTLDGARADLVPHASEPSIVAGTLQAGSFTTIEVENGGQLRAYGGFVFIREGQVNSFDTLEDRLEAALYSLDDDRFVLAGPLPMRFAGDGKAGFEAVLAPGERMALTRQALAAAHAWTIRLGAPSYEDLTCGLLDRKGVPVQSIPCAELMHIDDTSSAEARLAFYVELSSASSRESAELRTVAIASDAASDGDDDGVPTAVDNCPNDWNPTQGSCNEVMPSAGGAGGTTDDAGQAGVPAEIGAGGVSSSTDGGEGGVGATAPSGGRRATTTHGGAPGEDAGGEAGTDTARGGTSGTSGGGAGVSSSGMGGSATAGQTALAGSAGSTAAGHASAPPKDDSGCGCRVGGSRAATSPAWLLTALLGFCRGARRRRPLRLRAP
ncbi:MAG TPA: MYXO-CTERM sorting domain-containing protein [Polyangiaceae bacterium]|nr:MYXO-CTERM sorting domain-containing protein [Polyangiaceae bacterium]